MQSQDSKWLTNGPRSLGALINALLPSAGTMSDEDGKLFIKPCVQAEIDFYESAKRDYPELAALMPTFMGTLMLTNPAEQDLSDAVAGVISDSGNVKTTKEEITATVTEQVKVAVAAAEAGAGPDAPKSNNPPEWVPTKGGKIKTNTAVVLGNSAFGFKKPNILDVKLGVRLWADDAAEAKKIKFDKITQETTHKKFGFRVAGMRVYHGSADASELDDEGYKSYDKDYGRNLVNDANLSSEIRKFVFNSTAGIDEDLGLAVCKAFATTVQDIEEVLVQHETRMYSASLLFLFEGDGETLRTNILKNNEVAEAVSTKERSAAKRVDSGIVLEDEDVEEEIAELVESLPPTFAVKLIDFAHASWVPGQGPDENMLKGVRSIKDIFAGLAGDA